MYNSSHSHRGSAIIVALIIVVLLSILTVTFLEKVLNLAKSSGNINSSAQSYSLATAIIEEQLMNPSMTKTAPWGIQEVSDPHAFTGRSLVAATGGTIMPVQWIWWFPWKWNSEFDTDWNIISMGEPIQIVIPDWITWSSVNFYFRVPNIPGSTSTGAAPAIGGSGIILWTFGYSGASLYASWETNIFTGADIRDAPNYIGWLNGITNSWTSSTFENFYTDSTIGVGPGGDKCYPYQCTLKLSMIRPFLTQGWQSFPFLEYKIDFWAVYIPSQYMVIDSSAYINWYLRSRQARIQQITTSTAADFAILQ